MAAAVPDELRPRHDAPTAVLRAIGDRAALPVAITHTDPFPGNAVRTAAGEVVLIDWDEAGLGPAVVDLGYLLVTCDAGLPRVPRARPDPARVAAVIEGYRAQRAV